VIYGVASGAKMQDLQVNPRGSSKVVNSLASGCFRGFSEKNNA